MGLLVVKGEVKDFNTELEIFSNTEFGMTAHVYLKNGEVEVYNNLTEFHHKFSEGSMPVASAFESDIHITGGTRNLDKIESIVIVDATVKAKDWF